MAGSDSSSNSDLVKLGFLDVRPRMGYFPHVLAKSGELTVRAVSRAMNNSLGLWGERPLFRPDGSHYLEPRNGKIVEDFALWGLDANQKYLYQRATVGPDPSFKMFISANTPVEVLKRTYEHFDEGGEDAGSVPYFGDYIGYVCDWISDLRWTLIPLEGEIGWSIFAGALHESALVAKVRAEFKRKQIPLAHLVEGVGRLTWIEEPIDK